MFDETREPWRADLLAKSRELVRAMLLDGVEGLRLHEVRVDYTNIFVMKNSFVIICRIVALLEVNREHECLFVFSVLIIYTPPTD